MNFLVALTPRSPQARRDERLDGPRLEPVARPRRARVPESLDALDARIEMWPVSAEQRVALLGVWLASRCSRRVSVTVFISESAWCVTCNTKAVGIATRRSLVGLPEALPAPPEA